MFEEDAHSQGEGDNEKRTKAATTDHGRSQMHLLENHGAGRDKALSKIH